ELAAIDKPMDQEDLIEKILNGLDDDYKPIIDIINGCDTTILFDELHEKLINKELSLCLEHSSSSRLPVTAKSINFCATFHRSGNTSLCPPSSSYPATFFGTPCLGTTTTAPRRSSHPPHSYLAHCQWCHAQGHTVPKCPMFCQS
ncbi:hypothetical protein PanWU01x14_308930, partial [Parasponia andersonii]